MKSLLVGLLLTAHSAFALQATVPMNAIDFWNDPMHVNDNNCYNYGTNRQTDSFAQPGEASGKEFTDLTCASVYAAASADLGLTPTAFFPYNGKDDDTLIALVVSPDFDFHWYRRDDNGKWSHKMGPTPAATIDNSGKEITDPVQADRGTYVDFCGYFRIKNYTSRPDEQNGGFVRIGNMKNLPQAEKPSEVILVQYSGRRNPTRPLKDYLQNPGVVQELRSLSMQAGVAALASRKEIQSVTKLGYRGIVINDREGLIFAKGSQVLIHSDKAIAYFEGNAAPLALSLPQNSVLEHAILERMQPVRK